MRPLAAILSLLALLTAVPAWAQGGGGPSGDAAGKPVLTQQDREFVRQAGMAGKLEVEMGRLAALPAQDPAVREFGRWMETDHEVGNDILGRLARRAGAEMPASLDPPHQSALDQLKPLNGREFDRQYVALQVQAHDMAIGLFQQEAAALANPELKDYAPRALPVLVQHRAQAYELQGLPGIAAWGDRGGQGATGSGSSTPRRAR
jgi:putative membrane protein